MFPIFLDVRDCLCVVVGGGPVGRRKATALLAAGARVRLVCLEPRPAEMASAKLDWLMESYRSEHLDGGALLAFAAATAGVNRQVVGDAGARGILCNVADNPTVGDFSVPSVLRRGNLEIAVGTGGAAPGLARAVRQRMEKQFDEAFADWVQLLAELREHLRICIPDARRRRPIHLRLARWHWLKRLRREGVNSVRVAMKKEIRRLAESTGEDV